MAAEKLPKQSESQLLAEIRLALGKDARCVLWRNNSGKFMADFGAAGTRPVSTGLVVGASDLIGIVRHEEVSSDYGSGCSINTGRFLAIEVKTPTGRIRPEQVQFARLVNSMGGYACVVRSVEEAQAAVDAAARGEVAPSIGGT